MRWIWKMLWTGGYWGEWRNRPYFFVEYITVFTWIAKYITCTSKLYPLFCAFYWFLMCNYTCFYNTCLYKPLSWKFMFSVTSKPTSPTVFNLQALIWVHCEEQTRACYQLSRYTYKLVIFVCKFLKLFILPKNTRISKKIHKIYFHFFFRKR